MKSWTVHLKPDRPPVLLREGWSWGAFVFGPFWLLVRRAWLPAVLWLALSVLLAALAPGGARPVLVFALSVLAGLLGWDLVRWSLLRRGYGLAHVLAARDEEAALARLLAARPDLVERCFDLPPAQPPAATPTDPAPTGTAARRGLFGWARRPGRAA